VILGVCAHQTVLKLWFFLESSLAQFFGSLNDKGWLDG